MLLILFLINQIHDIELLQYESKYIITAVNVFYKCIPLFTM